MKARVTRAAGGDGARFCILGYTDRMHGLMHASDLFIGKPGGLTTSEALACGLPMAVFWGREQAGRFGAKRMLGGNGRKLRCCAVLSR